MINKETISTKVRIYGYNISTQFIHLDKQGNLKVYEYYQWNGANFIKTTRKNYYASMFHDSLFDLMQKGLLPKRYRRDADKVYYDKCIEYGTNVFSAKVQYYMLYLFSWMFI